MQPGNFRGSEFLLAHRDAADAISMVDGAAKCVSNAMLVDVSCPNLKTSQLTYILNLSFAACPSELAKPTSRRKK